MNILYINHYAGSLLHGMEFRPFYLSREWVKSGHHVKIVASSYSHLRQLNPNIKTDFISERIEGVEYQWIHTPKYRGNGLGRILNIFTFVLKLLFCQGLVTRDFKPDIVIASSTYPLDVIPSYFIAKKYNARLVHEVHDLWPLTLIELGGISKFNPLVILFQWAEDFSYRKSHRVVSMLQKADGYMMDHGLELSRFSYVPNGIVEEDWKCPDNIGSEISSKVVSLKSDGYFVFGYAGAHGVANALNFLIEAMNELKNKKIAFVFVGHGEKKDELMRRSHELGMLNFNAFFFDSIPKRQIPSFLAIVDAVYIGWQKKSIYRFGINPNKILDYMMAACPIVHSVTAGNDWVAEASAGYTVPAEDIDSISRALVLMAETPSCERQAMGRNGKQYVLKNHLYSVLSKNFLKDFFAE